MEQPRQRAAAARPLRRGRAGLPPQRRPGPEQCWNPEQPGHAAPQTWRARTSRGGVPPGDRHRPGLRRRLVQPVAGADPARPGTRGPGRQQPRHRAVAAPGSGPGPGDPCAGAAGRTRPGRRCCTANGWPRTPATRWCSTSLPPACVKRRHRVRPTPMSRRSSTASRRVSTPSSRAWTTARRSSSPTRWRRACQHRNASSTSSTWAAAPASSAPWCAAGRGGSRAATCRSACCARQGSARSTTCCTRPSWCYYLDTQPQAFDVAISADTLCYFGDLGAAMAAARRALRSPGWLVFTVEALDADAREPWRLQPNGRYAHARSHVEATLQAAGLVPEAIVAERLRQEAGEWVRGWLVTARRA